MKNWTTCIYSATISLKVLTLEKRYHMRWNCQYQMFILVWITLRSYTEQRSYRPKSEPFSSFQQHPLYSFYYPSELYIQYNNLLYSFGHILLSSVYWLTIPHRMFFLYYIYVFIKAKRVVYIHICFQNLWSFA